MTGRQSAVDKSLTEYMDHFRARVLQDALTEATAAYWRRRADTFAAVGNERCDAVALACRQRAAVEEMGEHDVIEAFVRTAIGEAEAS